MATYYGTISNGYIPTALGSTGRFWFYAVRGGSITDVNYVDSIAQPLPVQFTISNKYTGAGKQTMLTLTFTVDVDTQIGD
jgi:hypothetical protein